MYSYNGTSHVTASVTSGNPTGSMDSSGCDLLIVAFVTSNSSDSLADSKSNTWTKIVQYNSNNQNYLNVYYSKNPTVGSGHTFTPTAAGNAITINVVGVTGSNLTAPDDQHNGQGAVFQDTIATGSITPSEANCLIFSAHYYTRTGGDTPDSGMTVIDDNEPAGGICLATAYKIQTTAAAINVTWTQTLTGSIYVAVEISSFKAAAAAAATSTYTPELMTLKVG